jgi:hypothetical protein
MPRAARDQSKKNEGWNHLAHALNPPGGRVVQPVCQETSGRLLLVEIACGDGVAVSGGYGHSRAPGILSQQGKGQQESRLRADAMGSHRIIRRF